MFQSSVDCGLCEQHDSEAQKKNYQQTLHETYSLLVEHALKICMYGTLLLFAQKRMK